jgi:hypothetical protein
MKMTANIRYAPQSLALTRIAAAGALLLFVVLVLSEAARAFGYTDSTPRVVRAAFVLFTVLAAGAAIIEYYMAATCELQRLNAELERRLAEKSEEIRTTYACVEEAKREWAQVSERQRILADMHDGVGASLVGLLRHVQSGSADPASIERRVQEVLREMRIAIDALQPRDGDLAAVLGCATGSTKSSVRRRAPGVGSGGAARGGRTEALHGVRAAAYRARGDHQRAQALRCAVPAPERPRLQWRSRSLHRG